MADKCYIWAVSALYPILPQYRHNLSVDIHRIPECHAQFCPAKKRVCPIYNSCYSARLVVRFLVNFIGNIALFIPWGVLLPVCFKKLQSFRYFVMLTLAVLVLVEAIQSFSMLGSFDIEDILLNMGGACAGFALAKKRLAKQE